MLNPPSGITQTKYREAIMNGNPTHVKIEFTSQGKTFTDDDIYADGGITVRTVAAVEDQFRVGCVITTEVTINFIYGDNFSDLDWTGEFTLSFGVEIEGVTKWVSIGIFSGKKPRRNIFSDIVEFTATDRMSKFNKLADEFLDQCQSNTVRTLFNEMCTYFGFSATVYDARSNPGLDMVIDVQSVFQRGITCRKMLEIMAEATGTIVKVSYNGTIALCWPYVYTAGSFTLLREYYFNLEIFDVEVHENDCVYLAKSTDSANGFLYPTGGTNPYVIYDNPILLNASQEDQESMITKILSNLEQVYYSGAYNPGSIESIGNWLVECLDHVFVSYGDSVSDTYMLCICNRTFHWNGSPVDAYECTGSNEESDLLTPETKTDYEVNNKISEAVSEAIADKAPYKILLCQSGTTNLTVANGSRIRIDFITSNITRCGTVLVAVHNTNGNTFVAPVGSLGSNIAVASNATNTVTVTCTSGSTRAYCTIFVGDIEQASA